MSVDQRFAGWGVVEATTQVAYPGKQSATLFDFVREVPAHVTQIANLLPIDEEVESRINSWLDHVDAAKKTRLLPRSKETE